MKTLQFAAEELVRYFSRITGETAEIVLSVREDLTENRSLFDDAFDIDVTAGKGEIVGQNPRSVLLGVYRYLYLIGCRFVAPGEGGEIVPQRAKAECTAQEKCRPSVSQRAMGLEGSMSLENMIDLIDWLPKAGMNSVFIQFRNGDNYFRRWYTHEANVTMTVTEPYTMEQSEAYTVIAEEEVAKRGLVLQKVGHGWTATCVGVEEGHWERIDESKLDPECIDMLAMVGGKRQLYGGWPLNTNLCYSNPKVRQRFVDNVVQYATESPNADVLHVWLADASNNFCECDECSKSTPTDLYVQLLNEIDAALTEKGLPVRLVFLLYFSLMWPPIQERLNNPDRFLMMFAPVTRTFERPLYEPDEAISRQPSKELTRYPLNREEYSPDVKDNLEFLYHWQQQFTGDSFDFDYHLVWEEFRELGGMKLSKVLYEDCRRITEIGFNGFMSCQVGRCGFPSALGIYTLGKTLFDNSLSFEEIRKEYFEAAFGNRADLAEEYLNLVSNGFSVSYLHERDEGKSEEEYVAMFRRTTEELRRIAPRIADAAAKAQNTPHERAWTVLKESTAIFTLVAEGLLMKAEKGDTGARRQNLADLRQTAWSAEAVIQKDFDALFFEYLISRMLERNIPAEPQDNA